VKATLKDWPHVSDAPIRRNPWFTELVETTLMANTSMYRACYIGLDGDNNIARVWESFNNGTVKLHGKTKTHVVHPQKQAKVEVLVAFNLHSVNQIPATLFGSGHEKKIVKQLEDQVKERR
jgi:hypothetical protein